MFEDTYGVDESNSNESYSHNIFYDQLLLLNSVYTNFDSSKKFSQTIDCIGVHAITVVVLDEELLASCVNLNVLTQFDSSTRNSNNISTDVLVETAIKFISWVDSICTNVTIDPSFDETLLLAEIAQQLMQAYVDETLFELTDTELSTMISSQDKVSSSIHSATNCSSIGNSHGLNSVVLTLYNIDTTSTITSQLYPISMATDMMSFVKECVFKDYKNINSIDSHTSKNIATIWNNVSQFRILSNESESINEITSLENEMIDTINIVSELYLTDAIPGESFESQFGTYTLILAKISI